MRLRTSLATWREILQRLMHQPRIVKNIVLPVVELFTDAASTPARVAGVLFDADRPSPSYIEWVPDGSFWSALLMRSDNQIVALELLAVVVSIATFAPLLSAHTVRLWIDNSAGELQLRRDLADVEHGTLRIGGRNIINRFVIKSTTKNNNGRFEPPPSLLAPPLPPPVLPDAGRANQLLQSAAHTSIHEVGVALVHIDVRAGEPCRARACG